MSDLSIRVESLSKRYQLGEREPYKSLRDVIARAARAPMGWLRRTPGRGAGNDAGHFWALKDVSFEIHQGEVVGIIGRNGAGKSTLLKILSRITKPTSGRAEIYGRAGSLLEVGTGFHPELTGRENIFLNGSILGMKRKEIVRKFDEIVDFAEIEKFLDTPVKRYSSGMYVRLAFAVAAHLEPEILLVDEVLAVGDAEFQKKCLGKMGTVAKQGRTVLFVSHNMGAINSLCQKTYLFTSGKLEAQGVTSEIVHKYLSNIESLNNDDLSSLPRRAGTGEVIIKSALVGKPEDHADNQIDFESGIYIESTLISKINAIDSHMFILIKSELGEYVLSPFQNDGGKKFSVSEGQEINISCTFPFTGLIPGTYFIDLGVFSKSFQFYDWVENAISFTITSEKNIIERLGLIIPKVEWEGIEYENDLS